MALNAPPANVTNERKRVKVYELKNNDWYDRGTGFCTGQVVAPDDARIFVQSEEEQGKVLLETRIAKDDGYQKQQDTLIVWTEPTGIDMALSFQEPEGCAAIWDFVFEVQQRLLALAPDDLDEDMLDHGGAIMLPVPELGNLHEVDQIMRTQSQTNQGRDGLGKFIMAPETMYIAKLAPLVEMAEDLEDLSGLHHLCSIMKTLILLNDTSILEYIVRDELILGVVGALEYDPDFPSHKANHRQYLTNNSKFKEVVRIDNQDIRRKIHHTYRLYYLKDVVLARILDDPTFSVLNSLIFYHQVDIANYIQSNGAFLQELFSIFGRQEPDQQRKKDAVAFIQHLCVVAKNIQAASRAQLFQNFINGGLFNVVNFALTHSESSVRVAGSDILVALIDHDPAMMRIYIFKAINEKTKPLTDTLVELLLVEQDLGVKTQMADAIKVLLDPTSNSTSLDMLGRTNGDFLVKMRSNNATAPQTETFISNFYDESAKKLFQPLKDLEKRDNLSSITMAEASLYEHLVGILCFFIRLHSFKGKHFALSEGLHSCVAQLIFCPRKHLKLSAVRWLRTCISLGEETHIRTIIAGRLVEPVLDLLEQTQYRDNLLNSACLEFFEYIKREGVKPLVIHLVETYRERLAAIDYVDTFEELIGKYESWQAGQAMVDDSFSTQGVGTPNRGLINGGQRWSAGIRESDADEEAYFNTSDPEDEDDQLPARAAARPLTNGASPVRPLVTYPDDDEDGATNDIQRIESISKALDGIREGQEERKEGEDSPEALPRLRKSNTQPHPRQANPPDSPDPLQKSPPERPSEKRRREEDQEDALDAMAAGNLASKRRNSIGPGGHKRSVSPVTKAASKSPSPSPGKENGPQLRRKGTLRSKDNANGRNGMVAGTGGGMHISIKSGGEGEGGNSGD